MGREKKASPRASRGHQAKDRHRRDRNGVLHDWSAPMPKGLVAKPQVSVPKSKHHSYFEFVNNQDKKKKLEFQVTTDTQPPPGFEFVPIGNPALTTACKELSRDQGAMIFIVSTAKNAQAELTIATNRIGHHIRQTIVDQARASLGVFEGICLVDNSGIPEPIPDDQEEINKQADAAIRDLFPRIPNWDRQTIIQHAFKKGATMKGLPLVGLAPDITLSRRVQLAVLAHIRHTHTRYDQLLQETSWVNARKAVESLCLDILVKWRGDEETGRDQLDEILREVVVISDSEDEGEDEESDDEESESSGDMSIQEYPLPSRHEAIRTTTIAQEPLDRDSWSALANTRLVGDAAVQTSGSRHLHAASNEDRRAAKKARRGFLRYQAVRDRVWQEAVERQQRITQADTSAATNARYTRSPASNALPQSYGQPSLVPTTTVPYGDSGHTARVGSAQSAVTSHSQHLSVYGRADGPGFASRFDRVTMHEPLSTSRSVVSYQDENVEDDIVQSIEPHSPVNSHFFRYRTRRRYHPNPRHLNLSPTHPPRSGHSELSIPHLALPTAPSNLRNVATHSHGEKFVNSPDMAGEGREFITIRNGSDVNTRMPRSSVASNAYQSSGWHSGVSSDAPSLLARSSDVVYRRLPTTRYRSPMVLGGDGFVTQESKPLVSSPILVGDNRIRRVAVPRQANAFHPMSAGSRESPHSIIREEGFNPNSAGRSRPELEVGGSREPYALSRGTIAPEREITRIPYHIRDQPGAHSDRSIYPLYNNRAPGGDVQRQMPFDFISVSNMFPRQYTPAAARESSWPPIDRDFELERICRYTGAPRAPSELRRSYPTRAHFPAGERVVVAENGGYRDRVYTLNERGHVRQQQEEEDVSSYSRHLYDSQRRLPLEQRPARDDDIIYID